MKNICKILDRSKPFIFIFLCLSVFIVISVILIAPANSAVNNNICTIEEHTHSEECYVMKNTTRVLSCEIQKYDRLISHTHNEFCYDEDNCLICRLDEVSHRHSRSCYDDNDVLVCGYVYHSHDEGCFTITNEPVEQRALICNKKEHTHDIHCKEFYTENMQEEEDEITEYGYEQTDVFKRPAYSVDAFGDHSNESTGTPRTVAVNANALVLTNSNMSEVTLQYQLGDANWKEATDSEILSANVNYRIQAKFNVPISSLQNGGYQLILKNIPHWLQADNTGELLYMGQSIAKTTVQEDGTKYILVVEFDPNFVDEQAQTQSSILGTLYVRGSVDWRKLENDQGKVDIPPLDKTFTFESDLPQKYGNISITKSNPVLVNERYLRYTVLVHSSENIPISGVRVEDSFTTNARFIRGYVGMTSTPTALSGSASSYQPYETSTASSYTHGTVNLKDSGGMVWNIGDIGAGESRTLIYYAEIDPYYIGAVSRGSINNEASLMCGDIPRGSDNGSYTPKAKTEVKKEKVSSHIDNETGSGTISYKVTVKAEGKNSYTLKNLEVKDYFPAKYSSFVQFTDVKVNGTSVSSGGSSLSCTIPSLAPGQTATITYTVELNSILLAEREGFMLTNTATVLSESNPSRGEASGKLFDSAHVDEWFSQKEWIRKLDGGTVTNDIVVNTDTGSFTVPAKSKKYQVLVNEDGTWDLHSATFKDSFSNDSKNNISYTGWLKVEEYERFDSDIQSGEFKNTLEGVTPVKTAWVDINGQTDFDFKPEDISLDNGKYVYLLTYYATPTSQDFGTITITNNFELYGTIGINGGTINIGSVKIGVASKVQGSISYNVSKNAWYYDDSDNGYTYWVVELDGTIKQGFSLQDVPMEKKSKESGFSASTKVNQSTLLGIYRGTAENDPLKYSNYDKFIEANGDLPKLVDVGDDLKYVLQNITDTTELDGRQFVIANMNTSKYAYIKNFYGTRYSGWREQEFYASDFNGTTFTRPNPAVWTFHKKPGSANQYAVSVINTDNKLAYMISSNTSINTTSELSDNCYFTIEPSTYPGQIVIKNVDGVYLNFQSGDRFTATANSAIDTSSFTLIEKTSTRDYSVYAAQSSIQVDFERDISLNPDEKLYAIYRVPVNAKMATKKDDYKIYENSIYAKDPTVSSYTKAGSDTIIVKPCNAVLKEDYATTVFDGKSFPKEGLRTDKKYGDRANTNHWKKDLITEPGVYSEWIIHVNWDGTLQGHAEVCDKLPEGCTPVYVRISETQTVNSTPAIDEYEASDDWESHETYDVKYYYNPRTREVRWDVDGLNKTDVLEDKSAIVQFQIICKVDDPDKMLSGSDSKLENYVSVKGTDGVDTIVSEDTADMVINTQASVKKESVNTIENNGTFQLSTIGFKVTVNERNLDLRTQGLDILPPMIDELGTSDIFSFMDDTLTIRDINGEITDFSYTVRTDEASKKQILTISRLPADRMLTITYSVKINSASNIDNINLTNSVHWQGYEPTATPHYERTFNYALGGDVDVDGHPKLRITKVDNDNISLKLKGAEFSLYSVNSDGTLSASPLRTATTGVDGVITFGTDDILSYNTLYCIVETKAPEGYQLNADEAKHYVAAVNTKDGGSLNVSGYPQEIVDKIDCSYNVSMFTANIKNKREKIYVNKSFEDGDGKAAAADNISGSYSFGIYDEPVKTGNEKRMQLLTITYENGIASYKLDGVTVSEPAFTCAELNTAYYIYELDGDNRPVLNGNMFMGDSGIFTVSYSSGVKGSPNKAIAYYGVNTVSITNRKMVFVMPESGGSGLRNYYRDAVMIFSTALFGIVFALYRRYRAAQKEEHTSA